MAAYGINGRIFGALFGRTYGYCSLTHPCNGDHFPLESKPRMTFQRPQLNNASDSTSCKPVEYPNLMFRNELIYPKPLSCGSC
jgi:hypothetical protein